VRVLSPFRENPISKKKKGRAKFPNPNSFKGRETWFEKNQQKELEKGKNYPSFKWAPPILQIPPPKKIPSGEIK